MPRAVLLLAAVFAALVAPLGGCAAEGDGVPEGAPIDVVKAAPEVTRRLAPVRLEVGEGTSLRTEVSDLRSGLVGELLDAMQDPIRVRSFGGQQVQGISAFRYDVVFAGDGGDEERLAVWVDIRGRIRRVQQRSDDPREIPGAEVGAGPLVNFDIVEYEVEP